MPSLFSCKIPTITLTVTDTAWTGDKKFPCASATLEYAINNIPRAEVYVAVGQYLIKDKGGKNTCEPHKLLEWIQHKSASQSTDLFTACQLTRGDEVVLNGYIVSGTFLYSSTEQSSQMIVFTCMGPQAPLLIQPLSGYIDTALSSLASVLQGNDNLTPQAALASGGDLVQTVNITPILQDTCNGLKIALRLAVCVGALMSHVTYAEWKDRSVTPFNASCFNAFGGDLSLKGQDSSISPTCDPGFTRDLWNGLITGVQSDDVYTAIKSTLTSSEFGLQLVPRKDCDNKDDYRMDICPIIAWTDRVIHIPSSYIMHVKSVHNVLDRLNEPEILIVNGAGVYGLTTDDCTNGIRGIYGIYAKDPKLNSSLQAQLGSAGGIQELLRESKNYRVKTITAPAWVDIDGCSASATTINYHEQDNRKDSSKVSQPGQEDKDTSMSVDKVKPEIDRLDSTFKLYNNVAELMFLQYFKVTDTAVVDITPDAAITGIWDTTTGKTVKLENKLGYTVEFNIAMKNAGIDSNMLLRGCLKAITYKYSAASKSSVKYTLILDRVRLGESDDNMPKTTTMPVYSYTPKD